jgi:hypothetical protein
MNLLTFLPIIGTIIDRIIPDKAAAEKAKRALEKAEQRGEIELLLKQIDTNEAEANNPNLFVSGWRPFMGWICAITFAYHYMIVPFLVLIATSTGHPIDLPTFDMNNIMTVLYGMLGLAGLRTYEKTKNSK